MHVIMYTSPWECTLVQERYPFRMIAQAAHFTKRACLVPSSDNIFLKRRQTARPSWAVLTKWQRDNVVIDIDTDVYAILIIFREAGHSLEYDSRSHRQNRRSLPSTPLCNLLCGQREAIVRVGMETQCREERRHVAIMHTRQTVS